MNQPSDNDLVLRPLACFGLVLIVGAIGFGNAIMTNNGFALIGFLVPYILFSLVACVVGTVFAVKAYRGLPPNHKGRNVLTVVLSLAVLGVVLCLLLVANFSSTFSRP